MPQLYFLHATMKYLNFLCYHKHNMSIITLFANNNNNSTYSTNLISNIFFFVIKNSITQRNKRLLKPLHMELHKDPMQ